ncbi:tRNA A37 methylthiotransferase MiaB [Lipingzhangella halophila]|uniref:tRNA A37 methylthiotransferase MiaB n=1 Tax=Lipingzhangella halophila TaxID=1783352 RepID=A0A7W7REM9_9ACTN|nr:tRNA A37 methylthiotransferase MiaB [Lipingzhangella halophila]
MSSRRTVSLVTLGCARNEVDSEERAGRLAAGGWELVNSENGEKAGVAVNTRGFIEPAKREPVDTLLSAADESLVAEVPAREPGQR